MIADQEIEQWFLKNIQRLSKDEKNFFGDEFVDLLPPTSRNKHHNLFLFHVAEILSPEKTKEKLGKARREIDELFRTAESRWGWGIRDLMVRDSCTAIARFGEFAIDECLERVHGGSSSRKTAMHTLKELAWCDYDISKASETIIDTAATDSDYSVRGIAESAMREVDKEKVLKASQSNRFPSIERSRLIAFLSKHYYNNKEVKDYIDDLSLDKDHDPIVRTQAIIWPGHWEKGGNYGERCQRISSRLEDDAEKKDFRKYLASEGLQTFLWSHRLRGRFHETSSTAVSSNVVERLYSSYTDFINELNLEEQAAVKVTSDSLKYFVAENLVFEGFQHHEAQRFDKAKIDFRRANEIYSPEIEEMKLFYLDDKHEYKTFKYADFMKEHLEYR